MAATKNVVVLKIDNCTKCPFHEVRNDSDPDDWFNDDDVKVVCTKTKRVNNEVASSCRPYNIVKESNVPEWCPLKRRSK